MGKGRERRLSDRIRYSNGKRKISLLWPNRSVSISVTRTSYIYYLPRGPLLLFVSLHCTLHTNNDSFVYTHTKKDSFVLYTFPHNKNISSPDNSLTLASKPWHKWFHMWIFQLKIGISFWLGYRATRYCWLKKSYKEVRKTLALGVK